MCRRYLLLLLFLGVALCNAFSQDYRPAFFDRGNPDDMALRYLKPQRIVWLSNEANIRGAENLLKDFDGQVAVSSRDVCVMSTRNGGSAGLLLDFGREYQGGIRISAAIREEMKPVRVRIRFGESVSEAVSDANDPNSTATNEHSLRDFEISLPWLGTVQVGESGFRFVRIDLLDDNVELPISGINLAFRYRDIPYLGSFRSDNKRIDDIWMTGAYTVHLNMQNYLLEGIKRDRLVWLGDLHPEVMCVSTVFGENPVVNRSLDFARDDTPLPGWMNGMCSYSLWWIIIHKDLYLYRGDISYLREQHRYLSGLVDQIISNVDGNKENFRNGTRFLDWPTSEMPDVIHAGLQALAIMSLESAEQIAGWLGDTDLATKSAAAVNNLKKYRPESKGNKQAASLLSIAGLMDKEKAAAEVRKNGANGFSTFYGYYMLEALAAAGDYDNAVGLISDYWGGMLDLGATTFWEDFEYDDLGRAARIDELVPDGAYDIHGMGGAYCYEGFRHSLCHGWASGPTSWLTTHVLGITPLEPGCRVIEVRPNLGTLNYVEGTLPTPHGIVRVMHRKNADGSITSEIDAPDAITVVR